MGRRLIVERGDRDHGTGWGASIYVTLGSLKERNELEVVIPRAGGQGSHSLWRFV